MLDCPSEREREREKEERENASELRMDQAHLLHVGKIIHEGI